jgi:hypothetical protein
VGSRRPALLALVLLLLGLAGSALLGAEPRPWLIGGLLVLLAIAFGVRIAHARRRRQAK